MMKTIGPYTILIDEDGNLQINNGTFEYVHDRSYSDSLLATIDENKLLQLVQTFHQLSNELENANEYANSLEDFDRDVEDELVILENRCDEAYDALADFLNGVRE